MVTMNAFSFATLSKGFIISPPLKDAFPGERHPHWPLVHCRSSSSQASGGRLRMTDLLLDWVTLCGVISSLDSLQICFFTGGSENLGEHRPHGFLISSSWEFSELLHLQAHSLYKIHSSAIVHSNTSLFLFCHTGKSQGIYLKLSLNSQTLCQYFNISGLLLLCLILDGFYCCAIYYTNIFSDIVWTALVPFNVFSTSHIVCLSLVTIFDFYWVTFK